jgi:hypothetical protein
VAHGLVVEARGMGVCEWQDCHVTCELIACGSVSDVMEQLLPMRQGQNIMCRVHVILCMVTMIVSCITQRRRLSARPCLSAALPNDSLPPRSTQVLPHTATPFSPASDPCTRLTPRSLHHLRRHPLLALAPLIPHEARLLHAPFVAQRIVSLYLSQPQPSATCSGNHTFSGHYSPTTIVIRFLYFSSMA